MVVDADRLAVRVCQEIVQFVLTFVLPRDRKLIFVNYKFDELMLTLGIGPS